MAIPSLPTYLKMKISNEDGEITSEYNFYNDNLWQSLNKAIEQFNNGIEMPQKTTAEITLLEPESPLGTVWFNTSVAKLQVKTADSTIETITSA